MSIKPMRKLRTLDEVTEGYFRDHPEEIDDYLMEIFQDFAEDNRPLAKVRDRSTEPIFVSVFNQSFIISK